MVHEHLLQVDTCFDPNVKTMQEEIENLANNSDDQGSLAVLVVLAHGDLDGNICCAGDEVIAVQNVIKAFSSRNKHNLPKVRTYESRIAIAYFQVSSSIDIHAPLQTWKSLTI